MFKRFLAGMIVAGTVLAGAQPAFAVHAEFRTVPPTFSEAGTTVTYQVHLFSDVSVLTSIDAISSSVKGVALSCPGGIIEPGASVLCQGTYTTTADDVSSGAIPDQVTILGLTSGGPFGTASNTVVVDYVAPDPEPETPPASVGCHMPAGQSNKFVFRWRGSGVLPC
jgi:hypothetical protein